MMAYVKEFADYPPEISQQQQDFAVGQLKNYALSVGFTVKPFAVQTDDGPKLPEGAVPAPITLYPSLFPKSCFEEALDIQQSYNTLYANITRDTAWLEDIVPQLAKIDDFVENLWNIHLQLKDGGYTQPLTLGLFRSDYMVHLDKTPGSKPQIRQVEFNTIASSFGGLSTRAAQIHRYLLTNNIYPSTSSSALSPDALAPSDAAAGLAHGLANGHKAYLSHTKPTMEDTCILFIVQPSERNIFDQQHIENELVNTHSIPVFRSTLATVLTQTHLTDTSVLIYTHPSTQRKYEVTLLYYRAGYAPTEYTSPADWTARLTLERSRAIKCPTVLLQLAGMKKVQQVLALPDSPHLQRFLPNADTERLRNTFALMYPLDSTPSGKEGQAIALNEATAKGYVLKPQREGGGNNIYRSDIPAFLKERPESEWGAYVLMQMIEPPAQRNTIVRMTAAKEGQGVVGVVETGGVICELGIYGTCLFSMAGQTAGAVQSNEVAGYLLRTKGDTSSEGGVAAGFGALDSVCLVGDDALGAGS
ncbi:glutathione synthase [Microthyrium microscopicum]|uniref:Glutathione synthetase n=1 Tax=Microthyrium microscopicum TaxID=703497 RepID=A0A6A6U3B2_9PEZI|nr:glutathione synthase [Microthyrium microscopicum]